ncbi:putative LPS assembly protein LptD [Carboxylicivirga caseinilyticus]|uniref:putative LPS assembly protein LptD n=1 Tax=Carboxylicivirga caseinilyticus TaxID=3417572 RepID=UPI003D352997|nr:LPS-assembly protein LptD [Marinilabiliaceae bacterium A049]
MLITTLLAVVFFHSVKSNAQSTELRPVMRPTAFQLDSLNDPILRNDTLRNRIQEPPSQTQDTINKPPTTSNPNTFIIDSEVKYKAKDSIFTDMVTKKTYLYGEAELSYQDILLTANTIILDMDSSIAVAYGTKDSLNNEIGLPVFKDPSGEYQMREMKYNFKTEKAIIKHIVTEQGEGFVVGDRAKKIEDDAYCMKDARYTTCDHHDHPHFYLNLTKAKVIPGKKTITGPAYLVLEDVKLPLFIPFAMIPSTSTYSSGFIFPSYRDETIRGFGLTEGGYYWAANDYFDLTLKGDIFTNGSWASRTTTNYKVRYKYSGRFNFQYMENLYSEKDLPDFKKTKDMSITWSHRQDQKANPYQTFSASVNYSTSSYDQNNINSLGTVNSSDISRNTKRSSISYSKRWAGKPFNLSLNLLHSQNSRDTTIDLTIPDVTFTVNRFYPFKKKNKVGTNENFLEKISLSYTGNAKNYVSAKEYELGFTGDHFTNQWKNGMQHSIPVSMNFKFLKHFTLNPSFNYKERWYLSRTEQYWDEDEQEIVKSDPISGFNRAYDYSLSAGTSTKVYTTFTPWKKLFGDKVQAIRHVATPSVSFSYSPDFSDPKYGFYDWFEYYNQSTDKVVRKKYSYYEGYLYGTPGSGESGSMGISLGNTLEMKLKNKNDSVTKVKILESLNFSSSYNFLADSLKLSTINMSGRTKILGTNINFGARFDPYAMDTTSTGNPIRVDQFTVNNGKLARLTSANLSFGYSIGSDTFKKKKENTDPNEDQSQEPPNMDALNPDDPTSGLPQFGEDDNRNLTAGDDGYADFSIPWNISFNYSLRLSQGTFNKDKMDYDFKVTSDVNFNGNFSLTPKWKINFSSGYSFDQKSLAHTSMGISRDLHCWSMNFSLVPVGRYKSYFFTIRVNSSMLQDLKYEKRNSARDNSNFYN